MANNFFERISRSVIEREVEDVYNQGINLYFPDVDITHPFACDGYVDTKTSNGKILKLIIEYKLDELLASRTGRAKVLIQVLFYLKQFELNGMVLPNVCMVGDKNECFVIHINCLLKYLDEDVDWSVAPSSAYSKYPDLVLKIAGDDDINPFVFNIDKDFSFNDVARTADERYVYAYVRDHRDDFSPEAIKVLEKAEELVRKSFKYRELFDDDHKEYQILNWDAGFYQLKALWKEYLKDDFEDFKNLYKVLADKMRPMVYELGFLK